MNAEDELMDLYKSVSEGEDISGDTLMEAVKQVDKSMGRDFDLEDYKANCRMMIEKNQGQIDLWQDKIAKAKKIGVPKEEMQALIEGLNGWQRWKDRWSKWLADVS